MPSAAKAAATGPPDQHPHAGGAVRFATAMVDESWLLSGEQRLVERRLAHGASELRGRTIVATDQRQPELVERCEAATADARQLLAGLPVGRARIVASARTTEGRAMEGRMSVDTSIAFSIGSLALVATPSSATHDFELLHELASVRPAAEASHRGVAMVWSNGSGAVLLHEAVGHAAEHGQPPLGWPAWLSVRDEPEFETDDLGRPARSVDLLAGEPPRSARRASFVDVPVRRMSNLVVRQSGAPFDLPQQRIEVHLVAGGRYDRITGVVTLYVSAADLVDGNNAVRLQPFVVSESREAVARGLFGASGEPVRYPGVVCSSEGQELVVGSHAPTLLSVF